jgi:hypothetical protein
MTATGKHWSLAEWGRAKVVEIFGADLRSLAVFRVVLGLLVLADLAGRVTDLRAHYTDAGILPRTDLINEVLNRWAFSLNVMNGQTYFQALLFGITALAALGMLVGFRTRLMTVVVWVLVISIQWRNPMILNSGDGLLRLLLFWSMFLPLGAYWSLDRKLNASPPRLSMRFLSMGTAALFLQIAFMYWFTVILKSSPEWRVDGTALYYALGADQFATPIGDWLHQFPEVLKVLTFATLGLEALGPLLLFFPLLTGPVRTGAVLAFMSFHFGIWLTMDIGLFPWIAAFCMVCFLPTWFWAKVTELRDAITLRLDNSPLQHAATHFARFSLLRAWFSPLVGAVQPSVAGLTVRDEDGIGDGVSRATVEFPAPAVATSGQVEPAVGNGTGNGTPVRSEPTMLRSSLVSNLVVLFFLVYVLCWNLATVQAITFPERAVPIGHFFGLDQYWSMFAPYPIKDEGWYVIPGNLRDGEKVNLMPVTSDDFRPHKMTWKKPYVPDTYKNEHWRKYFENIWQGQNADQRLYLGQYICREWNARHAGAEQLRTFQITYMQQPTLPDYIHATPRPVVLWTHSCF